MGRISFAASQLQRKLDERSRSERSSVSTLAFLASGVDNREKQRDADVDASCDRDLTMVLCARCQDSFVNVSGRGARHVS